MTQKIDQSFHVDISTVVTPTSTTAKTKRITHILRILSLHVKPFPLQ